MENYLNQFPTTHFQEDLIQWFNSHKRDLPWRRTTNPYYIWVSEIMLQQTKVDTVIPFYNNFIKEFPSMEELANADEQKVLKAWEGLGYYSRVRNLQTAVREVMEQYGGKVPDTYEEISELKGVGPYTAGAVLSIAYQKPYPAVDGNVMRVIARVLRIEEDISKAKTRNIFEKVLKELISKNYPSEFNQGLMELGALVCTPRSPGCLLCPVRTHCRAYHAGKEKELPIKTGKVKQKKKEIVAAVIRNDKDQILIRERGESGLLAKLWEFPSVELPDDYTVSDIEENYQNQYGITLSIQKKVQALDHVFSHLIWNISVYQAVLHDGIVDEDKQFQWVDEKSIEAYPFPVSHQKIITQQLSR